MHARPAKRTRGGTIATLLCANIFAAAVALAQEAAYTNHAGIAISGTIVSLDDTQVVVSNAAERITLPLTIFPASERRRMAADFALATGNAATLLVPPEVRKAVEASDKAIRRSRNRAAKGLCSEEESRAFVETTIAARKEYLDKAVNEGIITPAERKLLE